jgi:hypothetical protein
MSPESPDRSRNVFIIYQFPLIRICDLTDSLSLLSPLAPACQKGKIFLVFMITEIWSDTSLRQSDTFFSALRDLASGCTHYLTDSILRRSIQDPLSPRWYCGSTTQGRISRYPFGDVGDRCLMLRDQWPITT